MNDNACSELASIRSKHAKEIETMREQHKDTLGRLKKEGEEERKRLGRMLAEVEEKLKRSNRDQAAMNENIRWQQAKVTQLSDELSQARSVAENKQLRIRDLEDKVELVKADKIRAQDEARARAEEMIRLEEEVTKLNLDYRSQVRSLQEELSSDQNEKTEFERRVGELEEQVALLRGQITESEGRATLLRNQLAENETRLAMLKGEQGAICTDAYDLGMEECRSKVSEEHPEWDLSFLDAESPAASASEGEDEDEYVDVSDTNDEMIPDPSGAEASGEQSQTVAERVEVTEKGEPSHISASAARGSPGVNSPPGS